MGCISKTNVAVRAGGLLLAVALAGCASGPRNPLHLSFEELGYAGEDVGSLFGSVKYRSVVNVAGLAPLSSVGGLHNRPSVFSQLNPQRLFRADSLPDYYSLGLTMECSKVLEIVFDEDVSQDDVWEVRTSLQTALGDARRAIAQLARRDTASALVSAYRQTAQAIQAMDASKFDAAASAAAIERERVLRASMLQVLDAGAAGLGQLGLPPEDAQKLDAGPTKEGFAAWQGAVQAAARAFTVRAATVSAIDPAQVEAAISGISQQTSKALRKGIIVTRWHADSTRRSQGALGSIVSRDQDESQGRQGFLVMGGIRLAQLMIGDDFVSYHAKVAQERNTGVDGAVKEQFLVLYTVGARYRTFFEESAAELAASTRVALNAQQLASLLDFPLKQSLAGALDLARTQSLEYERQLRAAVEAAEQGFLPSPRMNVYEFRFNSDKLFEHSMMEEKARSAMYLPVYSVRADIVQKGTKLLIEGDGRARSRCAQPNGEEKDRFSWSSGDGHRPEAMPVFGQGHFERPDGAEGHADYVQFHTPIFSSGLPQQDGHMSRRVAPPPSAAVRPAEVLPQQH